MVVADGQGVPLGISTHPANPAEVTLLEETLAAVKTGKPQRLICDRAYDSDPLRQRLARRGIELITPRRSGRVKPKTQDGRALRRYKRRWKIERTIAWLGNFRRLATRYEKHIEIYNTLLHMACALITLRYL
jgi:transposase